MSDAHELSAAARSLYPKHLGLRRQLQIYRPYICPFDKLIDWVPDAGTMLDVGCGAGLFLGLAASRKPGLHGIGFDADSRVIGAAQAMAKASQLVDRIRFEHRIVEQPWPEGTFDAVSLIDVLHHVQPDQHQATIEKLFSRVRPGGIVIYKDMADSPAIPALWNRLHDLLLARQWIHYRPAAQVLSWFEKAGASVVHRASHATGPYYHDLIVVQRPHTA